MKAVAGQFLRFAAVGAVATGAHYALLIALVELGGWPPVRATVAGFVLGAVVSYVLNRAFTFETRPAFAVGLGKFLAVALVGALLNTAIFALLLEQGLYYLFAQVIATGVVLVFNFVMSRMFVFRA